MHQSFNVQTMDVQTLQKRILQVREKLQICAWA